MFLRTATVSFVCLLGAVAASAATHNVSNLTDLRARISSAVPGDTIILANGSYSNSSTISLGRQGTAAAPIVVRAQTVGGVIITGSAGFSFSGAAYVELSGFVFRHSSGTSMPSGSHHCRLMRNVFDVPTPGGTNFVTVAGDDHEIGYNTFRDKDNEGQMLTVNGPSGSAMAQRTWIHHNYFLNFLPTGGNNAGALHIGHSGKSLTAAHAIVEYNLFVNTRGENEGSITSKVSSCTYRYNTFGSQSEELSLRHGNDMLVYGNFFMGSQGGLRIFGDRHRIYNTYFEGCTKAIHVGNGDCTIPPGALTCHDRPDNVHITFNTLVNNSRNIFMQGRTNPMGSTGAVIANNIIVGGPQAGDFGGPMTGATYSGNVIWNTSAGSLGGTTTLNPQLVEDGNSVFHLSSGSPAIDRATGTYTYVTNDLDQQGRSGTKDAGADEFTTGPVLNRPLTASDVGPNAGTEPTPTPTPTPTETPTEPTPTPTATSTPGPTPTPCFDCGSVEVTPIGVTANTNDGNLPANTVDDNLSTRWSGNGDGAWIRYDIGSVRRVSYVSIAVYNGNGRQNRFDLQTSLDGTTWTNVLTNALTSGTTTLEETHEFADEFGRYVRYLGHMSNVGTFNSLTEVSIFVQAGPVPTPTPVPTATPPTEMIEITPGAGAVSASTNDGNLPGNTVDGSLATRWSASGDGQWIQYDLGSTRTVSEVRIAWYQGNTRVSTFDVLASDSPTGPWTTLLAGRTSNGTSTALETHDIAPDAAARHVRIVGHGNSLNTWNSVTEVEIWGF